MANAQILQVFQCDTGYFGESGKIDPDPLPELPPPAF
jgi:hypothetical protein